MPENTPLLQAATTWHQRGIAVIPFILSWNAKKQEYEKRPAVEAWKQWQDKPQTKEEFDALQIAKYTMFGIVCGAKITHEGETVYLVGIDRDIKDPNISEEVKQKTLQALNQMPTTYREKTRSGGNHLIYFSRTPAKGAKPSRTGMELLSHGQLMVVTPSEGYSRENDNNITTIDDVETMFFNALETVGLYKKEKQTKQTISYGKLRQLNEPRPCIAKALKQELTSGNGHLMRLAIAGEYKRLGYSDQEIIDLFRPQSDFDYDICRTQVESIDPAKTASCQSIKEYDYCLPDCQLEKPVLLSHINDIENPELSAAPSQSKP